MKKINMLNPEKLYRLNKTNRELVQLLSPEINASNQELFYKKSADQEKFNKELRNKNIHLKNEEPYLELEGVLSKIQSSIADLLKKNSEEKKTRLDFDIAKIFHQNLRLPRRAIIDYDFWRYITLFYFIEMGKWRWEKDPTNPANWNSNAKAICGRALGLTLNKQQYDQDKTISYVSRNQRIDAYRYWWIANRLYDSEKGYYYIEKISDKFKTEDASVQQFLLELEGSKLLSYEDRIAKIMADAILLSNRRFTEKELENCFRRYNAYSNRLFMEAEEKSIKKEICLLDI